jgi:hypothetical protein
MLFEIRVRERAPGALRHQVVFRLLMQLRDQVGPSGGRVSRSASLLGSARRATGNIDEHHWQPAAAECVSQCSGALQDFVSRVRRRARDDSLLQIDED